MGIHPKTADFEKEGDNAILNRLHGMATQAYDHQTGQWLTHEQQMQAVGVYTALRERAVQAQAQLAAAKANADGQIQAARAAADGQVRSAEVQASAALEETQSKERVEMARIAAQAHMAQEQIYLEDRRLLLLQAEVWVKALNAVAQAPPAITEVLMKHVLQLSERLTGAPVDTSRQITVKEQE